MALIACPACGRQISEQAEACPQCGHPNRPVAAPREESQEPNGPQCYACRRPATTRCQSCNALSCAEHLQSIYVAHGHGGAYELRCESCYQSAVGWKIFGFILFGVGAIIILTMIGSRMGR